MMWQTNGLIRVNQGIGDSQIYVGDNLLASNIQFKLLDCIVKCQANVGSMSSLRDSIISLHSRDHAMTLSPL